MIRNYLPYFIFKRLFGDRNKYKTKINLKDKDWKLWMSHVEKIYDIREKSLPGRLVNYLSYNIMEKINIKNKTVLEIGPGNFHHVNYWNGKPKKYIIADTNLKYLKISKLVLKKKKIKNKLLKIDHKNFKFKHKSNSVDFVISFFSLEHIYNLNECIDEIRRVLKRNGKLVFAIPNEGSFAWGFARFLISRRWVLNNTKINYDKIICWEHPNFATEIIKTLNKKLEKLEIKSLPNVIFDDFTIIKKGIYIKSNLRTKCQY